MRVKNIRLVLRKDGHFYYNGKKVKAVYPGEGWGVMVELEPSQIDRDFATYIWVPSEEELKLIAEKMRESDEKTWRLRGGKGWTGGPRPYVKLHEFM